MTPETIEHICGEVIQSGVTVSPEQLERVLTRILCPAPSGPTTRDTFDAENQEPAARPDSAGEGGKDRAGEMAAECTPRSGVDPEDIMFGTFGKRAVRLSAAWKNIDFFRVILADALRAYGDELLEKIASEMFGQSVCGNAEFAALERWQAFVRSYKSSPTGATHV